MRNISLNKFKGKKTQKRKGNEFSAVYEELENVLQSDQLIDEYIDEIHLRDLIEKFLNNQTKEKRIIFMARYWYFESIDEISSKLCISESKTKMLLLRTRNALRNYLEQEGGNYMNADRLIYAIGNVSDKYVLEYDAAIAVKKKSRIRLNPRWSIAACLVLVVAVTVLILPYNTRPDDSIDIKVHIFSSYEEFSAVVPNIKIVENLSSIDGVELEIYGTLQDVSISDTTKVENFAHFDIEAKVKGQHEAVVTLKLNDVNSAEKYIKTAALTTKTEINGIQVHYAYNKDMGYWDSVVVVDQNCFNIHFYSDNEQELLEFLSFLLKK